MKERPTYGKPLIKDTKARTFITSVCTPARETNSLAHTPTPQDAERESMVALVYDITYNIVRQKVDSIVLIDDSIVRGTTLKTSYAIRPFSPSTPQLPSTPPTPTPPPPTPTPTVSSGSCRGWSRRRS